MKIALSMDGTGLSKHFGHCENFLVYEIDNDLVVSHENLNNPCEKPSFIPGFLKDNSIEQVISAGIGQGAINMLMEEGIKSIRVDTEDPDEALKLYLSRQIKDLGSKCEGR